MRGVPRHSQQRFRPRRPRAALAAILLTALACVGALLFRMPIVARYWAWRVAHASSSAERDAYLGALVNAGQAARWGISALLTSDDPQVRQYGVVILHHSKMPWARERLHRHLTDPDPDVRQLAALGLAARGDETILPTLRRLYQTGDDAAARTACIALEHLGTLEAVAVLNELAGEPADVAHRAALVDALAGLDEPACVPGLLLLLSDHRWCQSPPRAVEMAQRALAGAQAQGATSLPATIADAELAGSTIAERAAVALGRITGLAIPFSSAGTDEDHAAAQRQWVAWLQAWERRE